MEERDALAHPVRRRIVEYVLETEDQRQAMVLLVNEIARFKAESGDESGEEILLNTVRQELEDRHVPRLERAGVLTYDRQNDLVRLAASPTAVRARIRAENAGE
jgi:DNA-binding transcriptional ArsR family regulator